MKRHSLIIAVLIMTVIITGCVTITVSPNEASDTVYGEGLFDTDRVHTINIQMSSEDWDDLMERPTEKIKYKADITIDGEQTRIVSCSTKGNSSLLMVKEVYGIDRYSLKIDFGKYEPGQTFHGLHKLNLNNSFRDSTYMKDFLCYTMFRKAGVDGPFCSFAWVTVNGKDYGLFQAIEEVDEGFMERTGWEGGFFINPILKN